MSDPGAQLYDDHKKRAAQHIALLRALIDSTESCLATDLPSTANAQAVLHAAGALVVTTGQVDLLHRMFK